MINYKDIEQQTIAWFELRWGKIGSTAAKGLFVKSDVLFTDILSQRMEEYEHSEGYENEAMQYGNDMEVFARQFISGYTGHKFLETGWLQSEENELLGLSPDGITEDEQYCCEIKSLSRKKHWGMLINDEIPLEYLHQCMQYFAVNPNLKKLYFIGFRPSAPKNFIKELTPDSEINIGTKARPKMIKISDGVKDVISLADDLLIRVQSMEQDIAF